MKSIRALDTTQQTFVLMKTSWRRLSSSSSEDVLKTSSRRLDQDECICLSHSPSEDVFETSSRCLDQDQYIRLGHTSSRCLQDIFKTSSRGFAKTSSRHCQDDFKMSAKTSSRHLQGVLQGCLQDVLKTFHQVKLFALLKDLPRHTSENFMVSVENLQVW